MILMRKQMADIGLKAQMVTMANGPAYQEFIDALGPLAENMTTAVWWHTAARYASKDVFGSTLAYNKAFLDAYKSDPDWTCATGSAAGVLLQMAIERAGTTDRASVRAALAQGGYDTFFGPLSFNAAGQVTSYTPPVLQVQDKKLVVVAPEVIKEGNLRFGMK
jgi:branched-chain amino acid transport system substrate-binding protein